MTNEQTQKIDSMVKEFANDSSLTHSIDRPMFTGGFSIEQMNMITMYAESFHGINRDFATHAIGRKNKRKVKLIVDGSIFEGNKKQFKKLPLNSIVSFDKDASVRFGSKDTREKARKEKVKRVAVVEKKRSTLLNNFQTSFDQPKIKKEERRVKKTMSSFKTLLGY
jgi:hypothetical protein